MIERNDIHDTVLETGDHGPFNSWGRERYWCKEQSHGNASHPPGGDVLADAKFTTIIRHNRFRDTQGWGIDLDDGSSNYYIYGNLCIGIGFKLREGAYRTVENNIIINPAIPVNTHLAYENNHDRIVHNIIVGNRKFGVAELDKTCALKKQNGVVFSSWLAPQLGSMAEEIDFNLYFSDAGQFYASFARRGEKKRRLTLEQWKKLGYDSHSLFSDPMFIDPANGDFRVKAESPALRLGFKNFDTKSFGLLPDFPECLRK